MAAELASEKLRHQQTKRELTEALERAASLEVEIDAVLSIAMLRFDEVSGIAARAEERARKAEGALRLHIMQTALSEADSVFAQRLDRPSIDGIIAASEPVEAPAEQRIASAIASAEASLRAKVAERAARRLSKNAVASSDGFGSLVAAAAVSAATGRALSQMLLDVEARPPSPPSPATPMGRPRGLLLRKSSSEPRLALLPPPSAGPWMPF
jgi:hypothetical protein